MQKIASQSVGSHKSECFISDDGLTLHIYVNSKKQKEIQLENAWNILSIRQKVTNEMVRLLVAEEVVYEANL